MNKLPSDWFATGLKNAAKEVAEWPAWKQQALQTSASKPPAEVQTQPRTVDSKASAKPKRRG